MILYQYQCMQCQHLFDEMKEMERRHEALCPKCGYASTLVITNHRNQDWFRPHWNEHFDPDRPIYVESRQHLKELCKDYKMYSRALGPIDDRRGA